MNLVELQKLRVKLQNERTISGYLVSVGLATCGNAAGAEAIYEALEKTIREKNLENVKLMKVGCIGECALEPIVEVYDSEGNRYTYGGVTLKEVDVIVNQHLINGQVVQQRLLANLKK